MANWGGPKGEKPEDNCLNVHFFPQGLRPQAQDRKYEEEEVGGGTCGIGGHHQWYLVSLGGADAIGCPWLFSPAYLKKCVVFGLGGGSLSSFLSKAKSVFQVQGRSRFTRSWRRVKKAAG